MNISQSSDIYRQIISFEKYKHYANNGSGGPTGPMGEIGPTGILPTIPDTSAQTLITYSFPNGTNNNIRVASFITSVSQVVSPILAGLWNMNVYALSNNSTSVSYYMGISSVDADGLSNKTTIAIGSVATSTVIPNAQSVYQTDLYVPATSLAAGKRIIIDIYVNNASGNGRTVTFEFRSSSSLSHIHTTILGNAETGPTGNRSNRKYRKYRSDRKY